MNTNEQSRFNLLYQTYLNELTLQGKSPKTIDCYSRALRQVATFFDACPDQLSTEQLMAFFLMLLKDKSWSSVKIARNAIQFLYSHVIGRKWQWLDIVKLMRIRIGNRELNLTTKRMDALGQ